MEGPSLLPQELHYYNSFKTEKALFQALIHKPKDLIEFFEYACSDETWCEGHLNLIKFILRWAAKAFYLGQLPLNLLQRMVKVIQKHYSILDPLLYFRPALFFTIELIVEEKKILVNSLLFGGTSSYFRDLFKLDCFENLCDELPLANVPFFLFKLAEEFILKGEIKDLWRQDYDKVLALMRLAKSWDLNPLVKECSFVLKRYVDRENVVETLLQAHRELFLDWKSACNEVFNQQSWGLICLPGLEEDLRIKVLDVKQETIDLFDRFAPSITHLAFTDEVCQTPTFKELIKKCPKLVGVDFTGSLNYYNQFEDLPTTLSELNLSVCMWLNPEYVRHLSLKFPLLKLLYLDNNTHLTHLTWGALRQLRHLIYLSLSHCSQMMDNDLKLISQSCPILNELNLEECRNITDQGIVDAIHYLPALTKLNLNRCNLTNKCLVEIGLRCSHLTHLSLIRCLALTDKGLLQLVRLSPSLRYLNIKNCEFSLKLVLQLRRDFPFLEIDAF